MPNPGDIDDELERLRQGLRDWRDRQQGGQQVDLDRLRNAEPEEPEPEEDFEHDDPDWPPLDGAEILMNFKGEVGGIDDVPGGILPSSRIPLPAFRPEYDFDEEAALRLRNSVIMVKGLPYLCSEVRQDRTNVSLYIQDENKGYWIEYTPDVDLRPFEPGYLMYQHAAWYCNRRPKRAAKQGSYEGNTIGVMAGTGLEAGLHPLPLLQGLRKRKVLQWQPVLADIFGAIPSLALSNNVAVYLRDGNKNPTVEYKARKLGPLIDGRVDIDDDDMQMSWIHADLNQVGIQVKGV